MMKKKDEWIDRKEIEERIRKAGDLTDQEREKFVSWLDDVLVTYAHNKAEEEFNGGQQEKAPVKLTTEGLDRMIADEFQSMVAKFIDTTLYKKEPKTMRLTRKDLKELVKEEVTQWALNEQRERQE